MSPQAIPTYQKIDAVIHGIMHATSSAHRSEVQAWEEDIVPCVHTEALVQEPQAKAQLGDGATCARCELTYNLWLCLTCGHLGCGRTQFGGVAGHSHALAHFEATGHPCCVKQGTITAEGEGDVYCYACNDARLDPSLAPHLQHLGVPVAGLTKTEKNMTELQIEHNAHFDFSMVGDDGRELTPAYGPGRTGIRNLGNSCYLASTMQALVALPAFRARFNDVNLHAAHCPRSPAACLECQMRKLVDGLVSGRYAAGNVPLGVKPTMLKDVLGHGHPEFASMRQQDADEFLKHVVTAVQTLDGPDPTRVFAYTLEHRLECGECHRVRYTEEHLDVGLALPVPVTPVGNGYAPVALADCLARFTRSESLTYRCPACCRDVEAIKQTRFATFPDVLIVQAQRFQLQNWVPQKVNVPLIVPLNVALDLSAYAACGVQPGEEMLPDSEEPEFDMGTLGDLTAMGCT